MRKRSLVASRRKKGNVFAKHGIRLKASNYRGSRWSSSKGPTGKYRRR